jgi:hypothetical protein
MVLDEVRINSDRQRGQADHNASMEDRCEAD